jgi:Helix-turn-helix domain
VPAEFCRLTVTPRPALPPTRARGPPGTVSRASHKGPITRTFLEVLQALLWGFHNSRDGRCFPSYERIAEQARCARSTVAEALKVLEWAGVLTWQHRITRVRERCTDLFGRINWRWRLIRTSNAYVFHDPKAAGFVGLASKSENPTGTQGQDILDPVATLARNFDNPSNVRLPDSPQPSQQRMASNKAPADQERSAGREIAR